mmetsp:Transcript_97712/g.232635  ORF Transcript_97712/g.232635 Transcript_97712/m.232635 type:complete len:269 (+) Transcript_97712:141-947(+)
MPAAVCATQLRVMPRRWDKVSVEAFSAPGGPTGPRAARWLLSLAGTCPTSESTDSALSTSCSSCSKYAWKSWKATRPRPLLSMARTRASASVFADTRPLKWSILTMSEFSTQPLPTVSNSCQATFTAFFCHSPDVAIQAATNSENSTQPLPSTSSALTAVSASRGVRPRDSKEVCRSAVRKEPQLGRLRSLNSATKSAVCAVDILVATLAIKARWKALCCRYLARAWSCSAGITADEPRAIWNHLCSKASSQLGLVVSCGDIIRRTSS